MLLPGCAPQVAASWKFAQKCTFLALQASECFLAGHFLLYWYYQHVFGGEKMHSGLSVLSNTANTHGIRRAGACQ